MSQAEMTTTITDRFVNQEEVNIALNKAAREAIKRHALEGREIPFWENGQVVWREAKLEESQKLNLS